MLPPTPLHLGALHPFEQALVFLVAFGPFVVLGVVVALQRRRVAAEERAEQAKAAALREGGESESGSG